MLVVLVGLNGDTGQRAVGNDVVWLAQKAVAVGKPAAEQLFQIDLAAGRRQGVKIEVVNVNVAFAVRARLLGGQDVFFVEVLSALGPVFEHGAHGRVAVDIGVVAL